MVAIASIGVFCGALLGSRYKIYVLIPLHILVALVVGADALVVQAPIAQSCLAFVVWSGCCSVGYVAGAVWGTTRRRARLASRRALQTPPQP